MTLRSHGRHCFGVRWHGLPLSNTALRKSFGSVHSEERDAVALHVPQAILSPLEVFRRDDPPQSRRTGRLSPTLTSDFAPGKSK